MRTLGILVLAGLVICAAPPLSATGGAQPGLATVTPASSTVSSDYFPLEVGNSWIYQGGGIYTGTDLTLAITQAADFNGKHYFLLHGLPDKDYWLRRDEKGSVVAYDPAQAVEKLWWFFQSPAGQVYTTFLPGACCGNGARALVSARNAHYKGPIGESDEGLEIAYPDVFQIGIERELFLPGIGLVLRRQATGGPSYGSWELVYAFAGGRTVAGPELNFGLALNHSIYVVDMMPPVDPRSAAPFMIARIGLRNTAEPITLTFPTSQTYDFTIRQERGLVVYRWSDGRIFLPFIRTEVFGPGEKNYLIRVRLSGPDGNPLPPGKYSARGWLTTMGPKNFDVTVGFEIRWVQ